MSGFLLALAPVVALVALGRFLAWRTLIAPDGWRGLERVSYLVLFPALVVRELWQAPLDAAPWRFASILIVAQVALGLVGLLGHALRLTRGPTSGSVIQSNVRWNTFVALAIAGPLYGAQGLALTAIAAAAMIPMANLLAVSALTHFSDQADRPAPNLAREMATNPILIACAVGIGLNLLGPAPSGPGFEAVRMLAQGALAVGLLSAGAGVNPAAIRRSGPTTLGWSLVRLLGLPLIAVGLALALGLPRTEVALIAITTATPTAASGYVLARQLGGDAPLSANLIAVQTVLAVVTMPLVYLLALRAAGP